jgi:hypothetical protein
MKREIIASFGARMFTYTPPVMCEEKPTDELLSQLGVDPDSVIGCCHASVRQGQPVWIVKVR